MLWLKFLTSGSRQISSGKRQTTQAILLFCLVTPRDSNPDCLVIVFVVDSLSGSKGGLCQCQAIDFQETGEFNSSAQKDRAWTSVVLLRNNPPETRWLRSHSAGGRAQVNKTARDPVKSMFVSMNYLYIYIYLRCISASFF